MASTFAIMPAKRKSNPIAAASPRCKNVEGIADQYVAEHLNG